MMSDIDIPEDEIDEDIAVNNNLSLDDEFSAPETTPSQKLFQMDSMEDEELPDDVQVCSLLIPMFNIIEGWRAIIMCLVLGLSVMQSGQWAKRIVGSM